MGRLPDANALAELTQRALPDLPREALRAHSLLTFGVFLLAEPSGSGNPVICAAPTLAYLTGLPERDVVTGMRELLLLGALVSSEGELTLGAERSRDTATGELLASVPLMLAPAVWREAPSARLLRWAALRDAAAGSPMPLAAARAFVDALPQPGHWTPVSQRTLVAHMRYTPSVGAAAVARALERGIVEEQRRPGGTTAYRFASAMLHGGDAAEPVPAAATRSGVVSPASAQHAKVPATGGITPRAPQTVVRAPEASSAPMRVLRQGDAVLALVPEGVPITFLRRADGRLVPQIGGADGEAPFVIDYDAGQ